MKNRTNLAIIGNAHMGQIYKSACEQLCHFKKMKTIQSAKAIGLINRRINNEIQNRMTRSGDFSSQCPLLTGVLHCKKV